MSPPHLWFLEVPDAKSRHSLGKMARSHREDKLYFIILQLSFLNVILAIINHSE